MDEATGWCLGCLRTIDEIIAWSTLDDSGKQDVWRALDERRASARPSADPLSSASLNAEPRG